MSKIFISCCFLPFLALGSNSSAVAEDTSAVESRLQATVKLLASDELEGRGTGSRGIDQAADYVAHEFASLGLKTDLFNGTPFQTFEVVVQSKLGAPENNRLIFTGPSEQKGETQRVEFKLGQDFNTLTIGGTNKIANSPLIFVGYGITAPENNYDDYAGIDVKDKVVVMLRKEPQQENEKSVFGGKNNTRYATFDTKVSNAYQHGAAAVILVNDAHGLEEEQTARQQQWSAALDKIEEERATFRKIEKPTADDWKKHRDAVGSLIERLSTLKQALTAGSDEVLSPDAAGSTTGSRKMAVYFAKRSSIDPIIRSGMDMDLAAVEAKIDSDLKPLSTELADWKVEAESLVEHVKASAKNVIAVLDGNGPLADETIVVGAHYDHVGMGGIGAGSLAPWTRAIHNGADDNASGTAALLEIARQMVASPPKPSRRIVFIAFSAEERGLLGSKHYVQNPLFPLEKTAAMVNLDMVGRLSEDKLIVYGTGTSSGFDKLIDELNKPYGFQLKKDPAGEGPSDHQSFYQKNIPVFHFFTGSHSDYHRPSDDVEKINVTGMRRVTGLVTDLVRHLATIDERPNYIAVKGRATIYNSERPRPTLGTMPDYAATVEGCRLELVRQGGPADKAGLKVGDVITKLGENKIGSVEDYDGALRKFKPGDNVKITIQRDGKSLVVDATLGAPRN